MKQSSGTNKDLIIGWLSRLSVHFNYAITEENIDIFVKALAKDGPGQINVAFDRCLNECEFFPKLTDVHKRMPDSEPSEKPWEFVAPKPMYDVNHPFAVECCLFMYKEHYDELDPVRDALKMVRASFAGTRLRYERLGIDTETWKQGEPKQVEAKKFLETLKFPDFKNVFSGVR